MISECESVCELVDYTNRMFLLTLDLFCVRGAVMGFCLWAVPHPAPNRHYAEV